MKSRWIDVISASLITAYGTTLLLIFLAIQFEGKVGLHEPNQLLCFGETLIAGGIIVFGLLSFAKVCKNKTRGSMGK